MTNQSKPGWLLWVLGGFAFLFFAVALTFYYLKFNISPMFCNYFTWEDFINNSHKNSLILDNFLAKLSNDPATWGTFGDYLGGTLNPIISFLALIGLLYTIHQQAQEMKATREELKQAAEQQRQQVEQQSRQSEIFNLQQFESTFFSLLEQHNKAIERINVESIYKSLHYIYTNKIDIITTYKPSKELSNSLAIKTINQHYELKSYFNLLFQILKFISISLSKNSESNNREDSKITIKDFYSDSKISRDKISQKYINPQERMYSDILRSFIPSIILKLLALNCLTIDKFSQDNELDTLYNFQGLLNRYTLLEQLQLVFTDINEINKFYLSNGDDAIHFLILTSHADIAPAFGNNKIFDKSKAVFNYKFNYWLTVKTKSLHDKQDELRNIKIKIIRIKSISYEEYEMLNTYEKLELLRLPEGKGCYYQPGNNFNAWKQDFLKRLEEEKEYYEEKINETNAELKRIEENKKAWSEFLQIEDNKAIYSID
ncbi:hypothetical protein HMPREF2907_04585 [Neisseria sp. HMSC055H02]|nr:hypothetical protein HMPREF2907_04585 [Neisseria sp. HMSC055H02]